MRPCSCDGRPAYGLHTAELATAVNPPAPAVTDHRPPAPEDVAFSGGQAVRTGVEPTSSPPPAPTPAPTPQRPATHPSRRIILHRSWADFPLMRGNRPTVERVLSRPDGRQLAVEVRGSTLRAAPDMPDPTWPEAAQ